MEAMEAMDLKVLQRLADTPGKVGFCYKNLATGEELSYRTHTGMLPASVIKLYVLTEAFRRFEEGTLNPEQNITVPRSVCCPSCGAINYLHDDFTLTVHDLCVLMIILSDNTATNVLIDLLGIERINETVHGLGFEETFLRRKLWDLEKEAAGINNETSVNDTARWLEGIWRGELISKRASEQMLAILKDQRLNGKIPFFIHALDNARPIAHKTGEDTHVTHDVGIVFADRPFVVCFMGNEVNVPPFERLMADISLELFNRNMDA